jgi:uncharacterized protein (TIGR02118 family)
MAEVKCISFIKMKPGMTREEFERRWLDEHTKFGGNWKNVKSYKVSLVNTEWQSAMGEPILFDGVGELTWDSLEEMQEDFGSDLGKAGFEDGGKFMDGYWNIYTVEHIVK